MLWQHHWRETQDPLICVSSAAKRCLALLLLALSPDLPPFSPDAAELPSLSGRSITQIRM